MAETHVTILISSDLTLKFCKNPPGGNCSVAVDPFLPAGHEFHIKDTDRAIVAMIAGWKNWVDADHRMKRIEIGELRNEIERLKKAATQR